jgi:hypothetical protein
VAETTLGQVRVARATPQIFYFLFFQVIYIFNSFFLKKKKLLGRVTHGIL